MSETTEDLIGTTATDSGAGPEIQRAFHVTGIEGNPDAKAELALNADNIPRLGEPHPSNGNLFAVNKDVSFLGASNARVVVKYRIPRLDRGDIPPSGPADSAADPSTAGNSQTITVGSTLTTGLVNTDRNGNLLLVSHEVTTSELNSDGTDTIETGRIVNQVRTAEIQIPQAVIRVQRVEVGSPALKARNFVGTVNSRALGRSSFDGPRHYLCSRIDGVSNDGGFIYNVTYEFQHSRVEWGVIVHWIDPETGLQIPDGRGEGSFIFERIDETNTGRENVFYEIYAERDFRELGVFALDD